MKAAIAAVARRTAEGPVPALAAASLAGWLAVLTAMRQLMPPTLCTAAPLSLLGWLLSPSVIASPLNPLPAFLISWAFMVQAMTPPLLFMPLSRAWRGALRRRRAAAVALFLAGYAGVWMVAAIPLLMAALVLGSMPNGLIVAAGIVLAWQVSWPRARCLTLCHSAPVLRVFGAGAWLDPLTYGVRNGASCVGVCGPRMILPMLLPGLQLPAMLLVASLTTFERYAPRARRWRPYALPTVSNMHAAIASLGDLAPASMKSNAG